PRPPIGTAALRRPQPPGRQPSLAHQNRPIPSAGTPARAAFFFPRPTSPQKDRPPNPMQQSGIHQLSSGTALLLLVGFYALTFLVSLSLLRRKENVAAYMVSNSAIGFGMAAASMMATWIWAASFFASATSGYRYGISGPIHYGLWGALMILFIYP